MNGHQAQPLCQAVTLQALLHLTCDYLPLERQHQAEPGVPGPITKDQLLLAPESWWTSVATHIPAWKSVWG